MIKIKALGQGKLLIGGIRRERQRRMELNDAIFGRRSVREYASQEVDEQAIRRLIEAAVHAPNAVNQQPWMFTVVRDKAVLDKLSRAASRTCWRPSPPVPTRITFDRY